MHVTAYLGYDANSKPTEIKGFPRTLTFDESGQLLSSSDGPLDRHHLYSYDSYGRVTSATDLIAGTTTSVAYVMSGGQETMTLTAPQLNAGDASGPQTVVISRSDGQRERIIDPLGRQIVYGYTGAGLLSSISDTSSNGVATLGSFDNLGRPQTVTVSQNSQPERVMQLAYDGLGRLKTNAQTNVVLSAGESPVDLITAYNYDLLGNLVALTDARERTTTYAYNDRGEPTRITDPLGQVTELLYSATGCGSCGGGADKLFGIKDAKGQQTDFTYYPTGRLKSETDPLGKRLLHTYTSDGRLKQKLRDVNADGEIDAGDQLFLSYVYDTAGQLLSKTDHVTVSAQATSYTYWPTGRLKTAANPFSSYIFYYYDNGWLKTVNDGTRTVEYIYDALGRRELVTVKQGETILQSHDTVYDPTSKALKEIISDAGTFTFGVDAWGRRASLTYPNGVVASYAYNGQTDWLTGIAYKDATGATLLDLAYTKHDKIGNRQERSEDGVATTYAYDATDQVTQAKTGASEENFTYDAVGNRASGPTVKETADAAYEHDAANRMVEGRQNDYAYDDFGNRTHRYLDASHSKYWHYSWDGENRLIETKLVKNSTTLRTVTFKYDPFGRRIEKRVVEGINTTTYGYVYDSEDIVLETKSVQVGGGTPATTVTQYVHGPGIDEPLARVAGGQTYFYHADGLGSIVAISDSTKAIVQRYSYDAYGMVTSTNPEFENAYTYTGREWDKELGLYYYRARYYDPMEGRFISKDPIGFAGGDVNLYRYVGNQPVGFIDSFGLEEYSDDFTGPLPPSGYNSSEMTQTECGAIPPAPVGAHINKNMAEAYDNQDPFWFYNKVRNKGPWDYKQYGPKYEDYGNFNYGATGSAFGFPDSVLKRAAGWANQKADPTRTNLGSPLGGYPYGDDYNDQEQINNGSNYCKCRGY